MLDFSSGKPIAATFQSEYLPHKKHENAQRSYTKQSGEEDKAREITTMFHDHRVTFEPTLLGIHTGILGIWIHLMIKKERAKCVSVLMKAREELEYTTVLSPRSWDMEPPKGAPRGLPITKKEAALYRFLCEEKLSDPSP
jgi:hypothetical protein